MKTTMTVRGVHSAMRSAGGVCTVQYLFGSKQAATQENVATMQLAGVVLCNDGLLRLDPVLAERNGNPYKAGEQ